MEFIRAVFSGPDTTTENGAPAFSTSSDARVDLFSTARGVSKETVEAMVEKAWKESPIDTLRILFYLRDCRAGSGEKEIFRWGLQAAMKLDQSATLGNIEHIPYYGYWKDFLYFFSTPEAKYFASRIAIQLVTDINALKQGEKNISLVGKWAPSQNSSFDKKFNACQKIREHLPDRPNAEKYRKEYLGPLRRHLEIVETKICAGLWAEIDYSKVPSRAMNNLSKAFRKHDKERFEKYLNDVKAGKSKINTDQLHPHEIVGRFIGRDSTFKRNYTEDEADFAEVQWRSLVDGIKKKNCLKHAIPVCDVSGSMQGIPVQVSVALGLIIAEVTEEPFRDHVIIFSSYVRFHRIDSKLTLVEKLRLILNGDCSNTDYFRVHQTIVDRMVSMKTPIESCPQQLFIFSDMQFDSIIDSRGSVSVHQEVKNLYTGAGYPVPQTIFWNLDGKYSNKPVRSDENGVALVGGFSPKLIQYFLDTSSKTPYEIMRSVIDGERYARITM